MRIPKFSPKEIKRLLSVERECEECGGRYLLIFFRRAGSDPHMHMRICKGCEQSARDKAKRRNRWRTKAQDAIGRHARRLDIPSIVLRTKYGWEVERMAHDAEHAYSNWCPHCGEAFEGMGHGLGDITLDVIRPDEEPWYGTNTDWICATCNREKGQYPPTLWGALLHCWKLWRKRQTELRLGVQLSLLDDNDDEVDADAA